MAHVTFIHGILNKPAPDRLLSIWQNALAQDMGLDLGAEGVTAAQVYWADVLYENYEEAVQESVEAVAVPERLEIDPQWAQPMSPQEEVFVAKVAAKFEAVAGGLQGGLPEAAAGTPGLERVPLPWAIKRRVMEAYLRDVHHYLFNASYSPRPGTTYQVQDEIRRRTVQVLQEGAAKPGPHVVVGHSMGTVIAYDCLKRVAACPAVDGLMTIGSPLGLDEVQDKLQPGWSRTDGFPGECVRGGWVNVFDRLDPVAGFDPFLADDYRRQGARAVADVNEQNFGRWRHDLVKYLAGSQLRAALRRLLGL